MTYHVSDETNTEHSVENTSIIGELIDTNSQCELKQLPTKETLPGTSTQRQERNFTQPQELVESGRDGNWKESNGMKTGDDVEEMTTDISQQEDHEPSISESVRNGIIYTTSNRLPNTERQRTHL